MSWGVAVLKVFDRRFATQFRDDEGIPSWSVEIEQQYRQYILDENEDAEKFITKLEDWDYSCINDIRNGSAARREAFLQFRLGEMFQSEVRTYNTLSEYQGIHIPQFYSPVTVLQTFDTEPPEKHTIVHGVLIEYLQGFSLMDLPTHAPKEHWQSIGDDAMGITRCLTAKDVLNNDVSRRNFLICKDEKRGTFKAFMFDFGMCEFREDFANDEYWREEKYMFNEESRMDRLLKEMLGPDFIYSPSEYYEQLAMEFN